MKVWAQLAELFGNAFYRENSEAPPKLWQQAIWRLTDEQVKNGLSNLANEGLSFPPNLSQFLSACKKPIPAKAPYWDTPKRIEDQRPSGRMSFADWKKANGVE